MRKTFIVMITLFVTVGAFTLTIFGKDSADQIKYAEENFFRLHIRANSDNDKDQRIKFRIRDCILSYFANEWANDKICEMADFEVVLYEHLNEIEALTNKVLIENEFNYGAAFRISSEEFPYREYEDFFLPAGVYKSLIIELGTGQGQNWWCVLYPSVCTSCAVDTSAVPPEFIIEPTGNESTDIDVKYEFWILNIIKQLCE